jgi:hypothetical protein
MGAGYEPLTVEIIQAWPEHALAEVTMAIEEQERADAARLRLATRDQA